MSDADELFRYLERQVKGDKAMAAAEEMRAIYVKYMQEMGPEEARRKLEAVEAAMPSAMDDPATAAMTVHGQVSAEAVITAVVLFLARHDKL